MCVGALATLSNLGKCIKDFNMRFHIYGALEDPIAHAHPKCPLAMEIWSASSLEVLALCYQCGLLLVRARLPGSWQGWRFPWDSLGSMELT